MFRKFRPNRTDVWRNCVNPYLKTGPTMRFVPVKSTAKQDLQLLRRTGSDQSRTRPSLRTWNRFAARTMVFYVPGILSCRECGSLRSWARAIARTPKPSRRNLCGALRWEARHPRSVDEVLTGGINRQTRQKCIRLPASFVPSMSIDVPRVRKPPAMGRVALLGL